MIFDAVAADIILDRSGNLRLIELNYGPTDLCDQRFETIPNGSRRKSVSLLELHCEHIARSARSTKSNYIVLSPVYEFLPNARVTSGRPVRAVTGRSRGVVDAVLDQVNALQAGLRGLGFDATIVSRRQIYEIRNIGDDEVRVLYVRGDPQALQFLPRTWSQRYGLCTDKLAIQHVMESTRPIWLIPSILKSEERAALTVRDWRSEYIVVKPRYGYGSLGVARRKTNDITQLAAANTGIAQSVIDLLIQPWIRSSGFLGDTDRLFDIRVHLLDGRIVAAYARIAAARHVGAAVENELSWLTPIGQSACLIKEKEVFEYIEKLHPFLFDRVEEIMREVELGASFAVEQNCQRVDMVGLSRGRVEIEYC